MKKGRTQRLSRLFAAMAIAGFASYSMAADTIKIALAGPVTGPVAQHGDTRRAGALMAIEQINKAGGVNGAQLEGVIYDDACDPAKPPWRSPTRSTTARHRPCLLQLHPTRHRHLRRRRCADDHPVGHRPGNHRRATS